jgi:hypothetical protein
MIGSLLDQFDLHLARVGQRDGQVDVIVAFAAIAERRQRQAIGIEPGPTPQTSTQCFMAASTSGTT